MATASLAPGRVLRVFTARLRSTSHARRAVHNFVEARHEPMAPVLGKHPQEGTAEEAVLAVKSGDSIFVQGQAATPTLLTTAMAAHGKANSLENCSVYHLFTKGPCPYAAPEFDGVFRTKSFFVGSNVREATDEGRADYLPVFLSEIPRIFHQKIIPLDVALVQVSPPDAHGFCSLGTSVDCTRAALQMARVVIGQINKHVPRTHGDGIIHYTNLDRVVYHDAPLYGPTRNDDGVAEAAIGRLIGQHLVADGATLQLGIGNIPDAVLRFVRDHKDLGLHTEMFSDGVLPLVQSGVINSSQKFLDRGKLVATFVMGDRDLYDFVDDNPCVDLRDVAYTNDPQNIRRQPKMTAINSAIEVDYTGQVVADSIGTHIFSGVGGQVDFIRGASLSEGGRAIIAVPSRTAAGIPRIVPRLAEGSGVVTTRAHTNYVVTEYGIASLYGLSLSERVEAMIGIAHPDDREALRADAHARGLLRVRKSIPRSFEPPPTQGAEASM